MAEANEVGSLHETESRGNNEMLDPEQRQLLVVPYEPPPPPRRHLVAGAGFLLIGGFAALGLAMADYSGIVTGWLVLAAALGLATAAILFINGLRARNLYRQEMQRVSPVTPVNPAGTPSDSVEAI